MKTKRIILFSVSLFCFAGWAQEAPKYPFSIGLNYYFGGLVGRYDSRQTSVFLPYRPEAIEINIIKIPTGRKPWEKHYNYPLVGLSIAYYDYHSVTALGNLGKSFALTPFFEQYLIRRKIWSFSVSQGLGLGYHTAVYDINTNNWNKAISTHLTASFIADFKLKFQITPNLSLQGTYTFRHFSNGAVHLPNYGINFMLWGAGVTWNPTGYKPPKWTRDSVRAFDKKFHVNIEVGGNSKGIRKGDIYTYPVFSAGVYVSRKVSKINSLLVGIDAYYDESIQAEYRYYNQEHTVPLDTNHISNISVVANIGTEIFIGNFSYTPAFGWTLYQSHTFYSNFVHRHTLKYYFFDHFYIKGALKVYSFAADSFDVGFGVRI